MNRALAIAAVLASAAPARAQVQTAPGEAAAPAKSSAPQDTPPAAAPPATAAPAANAPAPAPAAPSPAALRAEAAAQAAAGHCREALALYKKVLQQTGDAAVLFDIGQCHEQLGEKREAAASYRSFVVLLPNDGRVSQARARLAQLPAAPERHSQRTLLLTLGGGAVMSLGAGLFFGSRSRTERRALHSELHVAYDVLQRENAMVDDAHRANLLFVISAALAVAGGALFALDF